MLERIDGKFLEMGLVYLYGKFKLKKMENKVNPVYF